MSIQLMSRCFDGDLPVEGAEQVLLLKLCDMANDDGACWPGLALLARSIRRHERQVRNLLRALEKKGLVVVAFGTGPRHTNRYRITIPPKPVTDGSTGHTNRQPIAGGNAVPGETQRRHPGNAAQHPGNAASREAAIAAAPESSLTITEPPHPPGRPTGVGVVNDQDSPAQKRQREAEARAHFERVLTRCAVADGPSAMRRWWIQACRNPLAQTLEQRCALVVWCVAEARARGRSVNFASHIEDLVDQWIPDDALDDEQPPAAQAG